MPQIKPVNATLALYREWRPRTFSDVVEQEHVVTTLKNSIALNRLSHAYLFCGTRGTGKTTLAQILSRAVNCLNPSGSEPCNQCEICEGISAGRILDVMDIDAASNNSVDNIRTLRDQINYAPAQAKYKVYIIDEVHMLTGSAFNALLKTLEEPPSYVIFILATTEPHKLPATILSRCQRFDFRRISDAAIAGRLAHIADYTGVAADADALRLIARLAGGAMRDAISVFDQCAASVGGVSLSINDVLKITGRPDHDSFLNAARIIIDREIRLIPGHVAEITSSGVNLSQYIDGMTVFFRDLLMIKLGQTRESFPEIDGRVFADAQNLAEKRDVDYLLSVASEFAVLANTIKRSINQSALLEVSLAKLCLGRFRTDGAIEAINARVAELERRQERLWTKGTEVNDAKTDGDAAYGAAPSETVVYGAVEYGAAPSETVVYGAVEYGAVECDGEPGRAETAKTKDGADGSVASDFNPGREEEADTGKIGADGPIADDINLGREEEDYTGKICADMLVADGFNPGREEEADTGKIGADGPADGLTETADTEDDADDAGVPADSAAFPEDSDVYTSAPQPVEAAIWNKIVQKIKAGGNPALFSILAETAAQTIGENFQIVLPSSMASLSGMLINPVNMVKIRDEINAATGQTYSVQVISTHEPFNDLARKLTEDYNIPTKIYP